MRFWRFWLTIITVVIVLLVGGWLVSARQPPQLQLSAQDQSRLYVKVLELENLSLQMAAMEHEFQARSAEIRSLVSNLYTAYDVDPVRYDLNPVTGEFYLLESRPELESASKPEPGPEP